MPITFKSQFELRLIVHKFKYKEVKKMLDDNKFEHLSFYDENLGLQIITVLDMTFKKMKVLEKLMKDSLIKDYASS